ncbi:cell wall protein DAN4-like [Micropterus salmoides]|uniref:cell wall protein DAN4-like n=1 Tax=Micropterus salmoides TaxID=27706 RepID=UPI0018EA438F|nr:cell wall protein DAN4-like [Micropterus salmoides]XP_038589892.1 cell wall protein DAN4-like [Micropterus salmoides]
MQLSMKIYLALLWGISIWFSIESMSASIPETSSVKSTAEPDRTTKQVISPHEAHAETETQPTHKPAEVNAAETAQKTSTATVGKEEPNVTYSSDSPNDSTVDLVAMNTAAATASSSGPRWFPTTTAVITIASEAQPSHNTMISEPVKPTEEKLHQRSSTTSTDMTAPVTTPATTSATTPATTNATTPATTPVTTSATIPVTTPAASLATVATSLPQYTSTTKPEVTSTLSSTTSPADSTQAPVFIQNFTSPSASTTTTMTAKPTSDSTSLPVTVSETSTTSTELSSTHRPVSVTRSHISTSQFADTARSSSTAELPTTSFSTDSAISTTAAISSSTAGILVPRGTKRRPIPTTKSTLPTTSTPCEVPKSPPSTEVQPCSTWSVKKQCLIAIASLAALATIFMVSTIVLCAKLSTRKYKVKKPKQATEMMCISALLPERNCTYTRQRSPVTNGVLVIHGGGDSDEDVGDNLTLSSFLPENDRFV